MFRKVLLIFMILLLTSSVNAGKLLFDSTETFVSSEDNEPLYLQMNFNFEVNTHSTYQINFTNLITSQSSLLINFVAPSSKFVSSNTSPVNESYYLLSPGEVLELIYEKERCELDVTISRGVEIILVNNDTSASLDINAEVIKDTGECGGDGFLPYPIIPMIFTILIISIIVKKKKVSSYR